MAEFKTVEQYVVERVEMLERELDNLKIEHKQEVDKLVSRLNDTLSELAGAYSILNMLRDFVDVYKDSYFGNVITVDTIYGKKNPELVASMMEYYDLRTEDDDDDES